MEIWCSGPGKFLNFSVSNLTNLHYALCLVKELRNVAYLQLLLMKRCKLASPAFNTVSHYIKVLSC